MRKSKRMYRFAGMSVLGLCGLLGQTVSAQEEPIVLRVCSWEEYIDLGEWDKDEAIELDNGTVIYGEKPLYEEFEDWYRETYGKTVRVEYSCFGTNEDLYNQLNMGDSYDLVCPSEYMIMKLIAEDRLIPYSDNFFDTQDANNFYIRNVSPYIQKTLETNELHGQSWSTYAAGYMWGITGVLYNPALVTEEEASTWKIFGNSKFRRQVTLKDNVRDSYFAALGILKADTLLDENFVNAPDYAQKLEDMMNDVDPETIDAAKNLLDDLMDNVYSLETDSGKADMITGKIVANYQWSGDAVYAMDQADEDDFELRFAVPKESTNLWFDGWVMLKSGIDGDADRQHAAEAFVNYMSMTENAVRNMYYIGYTSSISGTSQDDTIYEYAKWCYASDEEEEELTSYPLGYFFSGDAADENYVLKTAGNQTGRQLFAQYPPQEVMERTAIMRYFDKDTNKAINRMWIDVRCFDINDVPIAVWMIVLAVLLVLVGVVYYKSEKA